MLLRLLFVFRADWPAAEVDLPAVELLLFTVLTLRPLLLLRPWAFVAELLVVPMTLPIRVLFAELTRVVELEAERPAVLDRTSTVLRTFEDLFEDLTRELWPDERLGVDLLTRVLLLGLLERVVLDRLLLELLLLETDELRPPVRDDDDREELEGRLVELRELLLRELLLRELLLRELLLRELLLREPLLREPLLLELLLRDLLLLELLLARELFAKTGSATRIRARMAATKAITTCFLHFSVNMICLLYFTFHYFYITAPSELPSLRGADLTHGNAVF
jgi:hypothetical protein